MSEWNEYFFSDLLIEPVRNGIYKKKEFHGSGQKIVNMGELFSNPRLFDIEMKRVQLNDGEKNKALLNKGDLIFARRSLTAEGAGKCSIVKEIKEDTTFESSLIRARPNKNICDSDFLYYYFFSDLGKNAMYSILRQVAVAGITGSDLMNLKLSIPPLPTQKAIAEILSSLDDKIELNNQINQNLEALAQALFKQWFVDFEFPNENGEPYKSSGGEMIDSELGEIPDGWVVGTLDELLTIKYGKDHKGLQKGEIPIFGSGGIMRFGDRALYDKVSILIPRKGTLSNLFFITDPFWSVDTMFYSEIHSDEFAEYLFFWIKSLDLASMNVGSAVPSMTTKVLNRLLVLKPHEEIIRSFHKVVKSVFETTKAQNKENENLKKLRDTLLPKLISGELEVSEASLEPTF